MHQEDTLDSIEKHLDALAAIIKWALLLALVFWWAGFERQDTVEVEALGMKIKRTHALWIVMPACIIINLTVLDLLLRVGDLLHFIDNDHLSRAITRIALHPWVLNPFAYFGADFVPRLHSAKGLGALIVVWWILNSSLYEFIDIDQIMNPLTLLFQGAFLVVGSASIKAIYRVDDIILQRTNLSTPELYRDLRAITWERTVFTYVGIGISGLFALITLIPRFLERLLNG